MATESPTPEDPRDGDIPAAIDRAPRALPGLVAQAVLCILTGDEWGPDRQRRLAREVLSLPEPEGVAPLRASGAPVRTVEVMAAEIEAHAAQAIPASDLDLIRALISGLSLKEYAVREGLSGTAASQRANRMRQRLGADSNEQAVYEVFKRGLLQGVSRP